MDQTHGCHKYAIQNRTFDGHIHAYPHIQIDDLIIQLLQDKIQSL